MRAGLLLALVFPFAVGADAPSTVTIPINEYLELKKQTEKGSLTTIEDVRLWGHYGKRLEISFAGATTGRAEPVAVMQEAQGVSLSGCSGQGLLKVDNAQVQILPQAARFKLTCELAVKSWDQLSLVILNALYVKTDVKGADPTLQGDSMSQRVITFHAEEVKRDIAGVATNEEPSFQGRYQVTVMPEETKFKYRFSVNNPNRGPKTWELKYLNGEVVSQVDTPNTYQDVPGGLTVKLAPGRSYIHIQGRLPKGEFKPLLAGKGLEYLLVDNHPLLTLEFQGGSRRVSSRDTGMGATFPGARGFLIAKNDRFGWAAKQLDVFASLTYTVTQAAYRYYASTQSSPLVEAQFTIDNQGSPEIPLKIPGKATYLEVNGIPQVLTKDKDSQLLLRLPTGSGQSVLVQYQTEHTPGRGLASVNEELARPASLMSNVSVTLQMPGNRGYVFAKGLDDSYAIVSWDHVLYGAFALLVYFFFLGKMGWAKSSRWVASLSVALLVGFRPDLIAETLTVIVGLYAFRNRQKIMSARPTSVRGWVNAVVIIALVLFAGAMLVPNFQKFGKLEELQSAIGGFEAEHDGRSSAKGRMSLNRGGGFGGGGGAPGSAGALPAPPAPMEAMADEQSDMLEGDAAAMDPSATEIAQGSESYQGLPAKIVMPDDGRRLMFESGMLDAEGAVQLRFFTFASWMAKLAYILILALLAHAFWRERRRCKEYLQIG